MSALFTCLASIFVAACTLLPACSTLTNPQAIALRRQITAAAERGDISEEQKSAALAGLDSLNPLNWTVVAGNLAAAGLGWILTRIHRGPVATPSQKAERMTFAVNRRS